MLTYMELICDNSELKSLMPRFYRGSGGQVLGRGITVSPTNGELSNAVLAGLKKLQVAK